MKFSETLTFNSVPEWREFYIDYEDLKRLIYQLERATLPAADGGNGSEEVCARFRDAVDAEIIKVDEFFCRKERSMYEQNDELSSDLLKHEHTTTRSITEPPQYRDDPAHSDSSDDENVAISSTRQNHRRRRSSIHRENASDLHPISYERVTLRRRLVAMYVAFNELLSFADLNRTGVRKAVKKFDKTLGTQLLPLYTRGVLQTKHVFSVDTSRLIGEHIDKLVDAYASLVCDGDHDKAVDTLKGSLREHVVYERNTVWRELIGLEQQARGETTTAQAAKAQPRALRLNVFGWTIWIPGRLLGRGAAKLWLILVLFLALLAFPVLPNNPEQSKCFAVVAAASMLWATEALPLYVTSLIVPLSVVVLRIPLDADGEAMSAKAASEFVFAKMWSPVITVLLGGFTLAAALSKYNIAKVTATTVISKTGSDSPRVICLLLMLVAAFMCMWISNVAAPVLLFSVAQPLLRTLPPGDPYAKALILGIALASNVGGMSSPIASPQNILALQNMDPEPSWGEWFAISIPVSLASVALIWVLLMATFPPSEAARNNVAHFRSTGHSMSAEFNTTHWFIIGVTVVTIALWCLSHQLEGIAGDMGVLALVPVIILFGSGVLSAADFNNFLWTIVALAMGGIVLGKSVESCGLLATVAHEIQARVAGLSLFSICLVFGLMILVVASFISHTVAALIILPLVRSIGEQLEGDPHPRLIVMISALLCSAAMALPTSGFPNVTAVCMTDELDTPYLTVSDFLTRGIPASLLVYIVVVTLGYSIGLLLGY